MDLPSEENMEPPSDEELDLSSEEDSDPPSAEDMDPPSEVDMDLPLEQDKLLKQDWHNRVDAYFTDLAAEDRLLITERQIRTMLRGRKYKDRLLMCGPAGAEGICNEIMSWRKKRERERLVREKRIGKEFHGFMFLPCEIRKMIYSLLLIRGKIFVPAISDITIKGDLARFQHTQRLRNCHGSMYQRYLGHPNPESRKNHRIRGIGLLMAVSQQIQEEAEQVFWGKCNTFVFPQGNFRGPCGFDPILGDDQPLAPLKSISMTFDMRDYTVQDATDWKDEVREWDFDGDEEGYFNATPADMLARIHDMALANLEAIWQERCENIREFLKLRYFQVCFENCFCSIGCCRKVDSVSRQLGPFVKGFPERCEILGAWNLTEKERILKNIAEANPGVVVKDRITFIDAKRRKQFS